MRLGKDGEARVVMQYVGKTMLEDLIDKDACTGDRITYRYTSVTPVAAVQCRPVRVVSSISTCTVELGFHFLSLFQRYCRKSK
jgi:hypothetical protein